MRKNPTVPRGRRRTILMSGSLAIATALALTG